MPREPKVIEVKNVIVNTPRPTPTPTSKTLQYTKETPAITNIFDKTLVNIKNKVSVINIRPSTLHIILKYVMEEIEKSPIKGSEQKELALKLIRALVVDITEKEDEEVLLKLLDDGTISNLIDLIIDATRGKLDVNTLTKVSSGCINNCIPYIFGKKNK